VAPSAADFLGSPNLRVPPGSPAGPRPPAAPEPRWRPRPSRRDLLARVGVLARQSNPARHGPQHGSQHGPHVALDLFAGAGAEPVDAEVGDGMADLVPAGELRDLDLTERVTAELEILGFEVSQHVLTFYADLLAGLGVVRSADLPDQENGEMILVAGAKVATQTPAVRSGQRIIFASLDDAAGLVDLAFFESVQDRCAARLFASWLLIVRGKVRRAGAGPMAVTVNATECWDLPALEEIRKTGGMAAVHAAMAVGDVGPGAVPAAASPADADGSADSGDSTRPVVFGNGFTLSPYAETGGPGGSPKQPPRALWHASPGSASTPGALLH
jgi:error-prone DNA polymerase